MKMDGTCSKSGIFIEVHAVFPDLKEIWSNSKEWQLTAYSSKTIQNLTKLF
jgi:hypothetical protein